MPTASRTRYAADTDGMVCLLLDIRGQARPNSLQVFSYGWRRTVSLPRKLIRVETPEAKRWSAVSVPRWLANREGLHGKANLPEIMSGFCRQHSYDMRTPQMERDDAERSLAQHVVDQANKYRKLPGQVGDSVKSERFNANLFA